MIARKQEDFMKLGKETMQNPKTVTKLHNLLIQLSIWKATNQMIFINFVVSCIDYDSTQGRLQFLSLIIVHNTSFIVLIS